MPLALAVLDLAAEEVADRQRECVVSITDDHLRWPLQRADEVCPGRHILAGKGLKTPQARHRRPPSRPGLIAPDGGQYMKPTAGVRAAKDADVLAIDGDRMRPAIWKLPGTDELGAHVGPIDHELHLVGRRATTATVS